VHNMPISVNFSSVSNFRSMRFIHDLGFDAQVGNTEPELLRAALLLGVNLGDLALPLLGVK
jgi:hypothetical protein